MGIAIKTSQETNKNPKVLGINLLLKNEEQSKVTLLQAVIQSFKRNTQLKGMV